MIFFDIDDTLINHASAQWSAACAFEREHRARIRCDSEAFPTVWRRAALTHFAAFARGECSFQDQLRRCVREVCSPPALRTAEVDALCAAYQQHYEAAWRLFPDVVPTLNALASEHFRLGVLSVGDTRLQLKKLETFGLLPHFEAVLIANEGTRGKTVESTFAWAARETGTQRHECLYVTADLKNHVLEAKTPGWAAVWLDRSGIMRPDTVEVATSLDQIPAWAHQHLL